MLEVERILVGKPLSLAHGFAQPLDVIGGDGANRFGVQRLQTIRIRLPTGQPMQVPGEFDNAGFGPGGVQQFAGLKKRVQFIRVAHIEAISRGSRQCING